MQAVWRAAIIAAFMSAFAQMAAATVITMDASGVITSGQDSANYFGGGNLTGLNATFSVKYDTATGQNYSYNGYQETFDSGTVSVTINHSTVTTGTNYFFGAAGQNGLGFFGESLADLHGLQQISLGSGMPNVSDYGVLTNPAVNFNYCAINCNARIALDPDSHSPDINTYTMATISLNSMNFQYTSPLSLYLTYHLSGSSLFGEATDIGASLVLAATAPANSVKVPGTLPANTTSLNEAASALGYVGFDWVQTITSLPNPSPFSQCANIQCSASIPLSGNAVPFLDPVENGYTYCATTNCATAFPFYYTLSSVTDNSNPCIKYSGSACITTLTPNGDSTLNFFDAPADACISSPGGLPSVAWLTNASIRSLCGGETTQTNSPIDFTTELVGVLPSFQAGEAGSCVDLKTCVVLGTLKWADNFNGTTGGIATTYSDEVTDTGSGTGGITVLSLSASPVPEPSATYMWAFALFLLWALNRTRQRSYAAVQG
jgi:hypothetical protein